MITRDITSTKERDAKDVDKGTTMPVEENPEVDEHYS